MTYINFNRRTLLDTGSDSTVEGAVIRSGGKHTTKTITLSANNTSASVNVFLFTGTVEIKSLHGEITLATTLTNCTNIYFDLWDGTTSKVLSKITGANISGLSVGSFIIRDSSSATELTVLSNATCNFKEAATGNRIMSNFVITAKLSTNTYIRFNYTTTDAPINAQIKIDCSWADIDNGSITSV